MVAFILINLFLYDYLSVFYAIILGIFCYAARLFSLPRVNIVGVVNVQHVTTMGAYVYFFLYFIQLNQSYHNY